MAIKHITSNAGMSVNDRPGVDIGVLLAEGVAVAFMGVTVRFVISVGAGVDVGVAVGAGVDVGVAVSGGLPDDTA
jgi:hypothetical protein